MERVKIKKISFLVVLCLCLITGAKAQNTKQNERKDFSFKITKEKDSEGYVNIVKLSTYVGSQLIDNYSFKVPSPLPEDPDIDINLGYRGGGSANNIQHEALLWNQQQHAFVKTDGYNDIGEPQLDPKNKVIFTVLNSYSDVTKTYYRWDGNKLVEYLSETAKIEDDKVIDFSEMLNFPLYTLEAKLNGRTPVIITFQKNEKDIVAGYIYYPRAKNPAPIMIKGIYDNGTYDLRERLDDGTTTGYICLKCDKDENWSGGWANPTTHKELKLTDISFSHEAQKWFTKSLFLEN